MKFWDSSAIMPLLIPEEMSSWCQSIFRQDSHLIVWFFTSTEVISALARLGRAERVEATQIQAARNQLKRLSEAWAEVHRFETVRSRAQRLLDVHALRAADALQLGAALIAFDDHPEEAEFICLDQQLAAAAEKEGFTVLPK